LNEKDIHEVQSIIKKYLTDLIEKIIDIHEPLTYELLFASNKLIKNDLFFLVDNIDHDDETMKETIEETIKQIESSEISYNDFDNDLKVKMDNTVVDNLVAKHFNVDKPFVTELAKALHDIRIQDNPNNQASTSNRFGIFKQDSLSSDMAADSRINLLSEDAPGV
jgi:hypothetical protein